MKTNKIYRLFFNMMIAESNDVKRYDIDETFIALTDGYMAYKVLRRDIPLNIDRIKDITNKNLPKIEITDEHKILTRTSELMDSSLYGKPTYARKYQGNDFCCWLNEAFVEVFDNPTFYGTGEVNPVVVCEGRNREPRGLVLPIKTTRYDL